MAEQQYKTVRVRLAQYEQIKKSVNKSGLKIMTFVEQAIETKLKTDKANH